MYLQTRGHKFVRWCRLAANATFFAESTISVIIDVQFDAVAIGVLIAPSFSNKLHDLATLLEERCRTRGGAQERDDNHSICSRELMDRTAGTV